MRMSDLYITDADVKRLVRQNPWLLEDSDPDSRAEFCLRQMGLEPTRRNVAMCIRLLERCDTVQRPD